MTHSSPGRLLPNGSPQTIDGHSSSSSWMAGGLAGRCPPRGLAWSGVCNSASNTALSNGQISVLRNPLVAESTVADLL